MGVLTLPYLLTLAAADAINPCELAVLALVLVAILTRFPRDRKKVLYTGFAFTLAIFLMYLLYGFILVNTFNFLSSLAGVKLWLYRGVGCIGIILGLMNIKDFFKYGGGGFVTEVPHSWRRRMKKFIASITSWKGAFLIGLVVALFLTPCTMGPYLIFVGIMSEIGFLAGLPYLLLYNLIFVLPMILITLLVYLGFTTVENVQGWREKNIRILHLIAGSILVIIGIAMLFGFGV